MNGLPTHDVQRLRITRLIALGIAWLAPVLIATVRDFSVMSLIGGIFYPTIRKLILLVGIGLQVYRLVKPVTGQPRVYEYVETQGEVAILVMLLFFDLGLRYVNRGFGGDLIQWGWSVADWAMMLGLYAGRMRVVIDGNARTVTIGDLIPRTKTFEQIRGLGTITIRMLRNGVHTGTTHRVGLFVGNGAPMRLDVCYAPIEVENKIRAIVMETGVPIARA